MATLYNVLRRIVNNPEVQLVGGLLLLAFTLISIFTEHLALHHGLFAMALIHVWAAIPNIIQALERITKGLKNGNKNKNSR